MALLDQDKLAGEFGRGHSQASSERLLKHAEIHMMAAQVAATLSTRFGESVVDAEWGPVLRKETR
jgi:hypothetical protein